MNIEVFYCLFNNNWNYFPTMFFDAETEIGLTVSNRHCIQGWIWNTFIMFQAADSCQLFPFQFSKTF